MTEEEFRIMHSKIIEHYQFIEFHLEGIYAMINGNDFIVGLKEVETHNIGRLLKTIKQIEQKQNIKVLSEDLYIKLQNVYVRRNFWCHNCYVDMIFDRKTDVPKKESDINEMRSDLQEALLIRNFLYEEKMKLKN